MAGVVVIDRHPVERRAEVLLHLRHDIARKRLQVLVIATRTGDAAHQGRAQRRWGANRVTARASQRGSERSPSCAISLKLGGRADAGKYLPDRCLKHLKKDQWRSEQSPQLLDGSGSLQNDVQTITYARMASNAVRFILHSSSSLPSLCLTASVGVPQAWLDAVQDFQKETARERNGSPVQANIGAVNVRLASRISVSDSQKIGCQVSIGVRLAGATITASGGAKAGPLYAKGQPVVQPEGAASASRAWCSRTIAHVSR